MAFIRIVNIGAQFVRVFSAVQVYLDGDELFLDIHVRLQPESIAVLAVFYPEIASLEGYAAKPLQRMDHPVVLEKLRYLVHDCMCPAHLRRKKTAQFVMVIALSLRVVPLRRGNRQGDDSLAAVSESAPSKSQYS
jgi:hypothetical protein